MPEQTFDVAIDTTKFDALRKAFQTGRLVSILLERKDGITHVKCDYDTFSLSFESDEVDCQPATVEETLAYHMDFNKMRNISFEIKTEVKK